MIRAGIFGPSMSGKTTLAKALSLEYFKRDKIQTLVLDPHQEEWGEQAKLFTDEGKFWDSVWASDNCLVIVEEAASTINRNNDLIPVFTRLRHRHHKLIVVGHSGRDLLPVMRQQIDTLYLFRQPMSASKVWAEVMADDDLLAASTLNQFEFIVKESFKPTKKLILAKPKT